MTHPRSRRTLTRLISSAALSLALVMSGATVVHASDLVDVPDAKLAACIRAKLTAAGLGEDLTAENLARLTRMSCTNVSDLTGIEHLTGVTDLWVQFDDSVDLSRFADMPALRTLVTGSSGLTSLSSLPTLPRLTTLRVQNTKLSDLSPLAGFTGLQTLSLSGNQISDLRPLAGMTALTSLTLGSNQIHSLAGLEHLSKLTTLDFSSNQVTDLSALAGATHLSELEAISNQIETLGDEGSLKSLTKVNLTWNRIGSIAALSGAPLTSAILSGNLISDISPLSGIAPKATVYLRDNRVRDFSPLPDDVNLDGYGQTPVDPTEAVVGMPLDFGVRDVDGTPLCLWQLPEGATCEDGRGTYTIPGKVEIGFLGSSFSVSWVQPVGPTGHFTSPRPFALTGIPMVNEALWLPSQSWTPTSDSVTYQWYADGQPLDRPPPYVVLVPTKAELGKRIKVCITAHRQSFYDERVCSAETTPVQAVPGTTSIITSPAPKIIGRVKVGYKLSISLHPWDAGVTFHFRWQRNGKDIKGATHDLYRLTRADLHKKIRMKLTGTKPGCKSVIRYSNAVRPKR